MLKITLLALTCKANFVETILMVDSYIEHCKDEPDIVLVTEEEFVPMFKEHCPAARIITLESLSTAKMLADKDTKTPSEHAWTHKAAAVLKCFELGSEIVFMAGSDLFFYDDINTVIHEEILTQGNELDGGVLCSSHRFLPNQDYTYIAGKYNTDVTVFWGPEGRKAAEKWHGLLENFCYRSENPLQKEGERPQCGDQTYLEELNPMVISHQGVNLADYNAGWFTFAQSPKGTVFVIDPADKVWKVICYQMHDLHYEINEGKVNIGSGYPLRQEQVCAIHGPYIQLFEEAKNQLEVG